MATNYNMNDYVVVNGRKYYATGGNSDSPQKIPNKKGMLEYVENILRNKELKDDGTPKYSNEFGETKSSYIQSPYAQSENHGDNLFKQYSKDIQEKIKQGRTAWANELQRRIDDGWGDYLKEEYGITPKDIENFRKNNWDDESSQKINYYMSQRYPSLVLPDKKTPGRVLSGDNVFWALAATSESEDRARPIKTHWNELNKMGYSNDYLTNPNKRWTVHEVKDGDNKGSFIYSLYDDYANPKPTILIRNNDGTWGGYINEYDPKNTVAANQQYSNVYDFNNNAKPRQSTLYYRSDKGNVLKNNIIPSNQLGLKFADTVEGWKCGGKMSRRTQHYYAVGGTTGEQIPIGEVEQPNNYNMVGEGGTHEQNPMGGIPYGVNQDGTQNMVEQGEVSVGNNVFSDRTQMSPELCQQLGLPEGTSPAQAMQQIEALYEQGQIGDEEFQEIQQIIFQDQEAQKQGAEGNIEQMQSEMPSEGIQPDMMQGASMPPEMMQQGAQPMQPPMQQGAPEGIQPEMVQGYGFGGRRWGCR